MSEAWRIWLYPLGVLPILLFTGRFAVQWLASEARGRSVVPRLFWVFSLCGHGLMALHGMIQLQFPISLAQATSGVIAWRNLNLMKPLSQRFSTKSAAVIMLMTALSIIAFFTLQNEWFRAPRLAEHLQPVQLSQRWHLFGACGIFLFAIRFWVQWWQAETAQTSYLSASFWWISVVGNTMTLIYFFFLKDPINCIGPIFGMIPYIRNLMLLRRKGREVCRS